MSNNQQNINQPKTNQPAKPTIVDSKEKPKNDEYSVDKTPKKSNDNDHCGTKDKKAQ